jgi:nitrate/nitrite transport system substrate-binding protein
MTDPTSPDPFDPIALSGCACGRHSRAAECDAQTLPDDVIEAAALRALFPRANTRRRFVAAVGATAAAEALASVFPLGSLRAMAMDDPLGKLERASLKIGFLPINCAAPIIIADPMGFYAREGLKVELVKTAGWAIVRDRVASGELDASHFLAPMPLAMSVGLGAQPQAMRVASIQNINGQAITLSLRHRNNRDPRRWKGFRFAIPFEYSMHNFLLRYYLAEHGLDPDRDVQLRVTPPAEMITNLLTGDIDGFLGPEPFNQRAVFEKVGFIHILTRDIWDGHPCCAFGVSDRFVRTNPKSFTALFRAILKATAAANRPENRADIARMIAPERYLNQPEIVIRQGLTGRFADGLGNVVDVPDRSGFDATPWYSMATWMLTQMKRWGYVKGDVDYRQLAEKVFMLTDARRLMGELRLPVDAGASGYPSFKIMGRTFDPTQPDAYVRSFAIRRT